MINYIVEDFNCQAMIYSDNELIHYFRYKRIFTSLCDRYYLNLARYNKEMKRRHGFKYNIPIYFSNDLVMIRVTIDNYTYYINYMAIASLSHNDNDLLIIFRNGEYLLLKIKKSIFYNYINKSRTIINFIQEDIILK